MLSSTPLCQHRAKPWTQFKLVYNTVQRLEANSTKFLETVNKTLNLHITLKNELDVLTQRRSELECKVAAAASHFPLPNYSETLNSIMKRMLQVENKATGESTERYHKPSRRPH